VYYNFISGWKQHVDSYGEHAEKAIFLEYIASPRG
jgi:hypothetical protein